MELASMLPGFRFLFAAIVLSMSVLIFGLGAAALLRSAHEEFANLPSRRATPEPMFARLSDDTPPTLALLRIDPPVPEKPADDLPADGPSAAPDTIPTQAEQTQADQTPEASPAEPEKLATSPDPMQEELAKAEELVGQASTETTAVPVASPEAPGVNAQVTIASAVEPDAATPPAISPQPAENFLPFEPSIATTVIATLGGPAVQIEETKSTSEGKPDARTARKIAAERARERRRIAAARRARLAREATLTLQQQQPNPFLFPMAPATR